MGIVQMSLQPIIERVASLVWYAVRVKSGREAKAVADLRERLFDTYLPMETRMRRTLRGRTRVEHPLIPGYLFVGVKPHQSLYFVTRVETVQSIVCQGGQPYEIHHHDGRHFVYDLQARQAAGEFDHTPKKKPLIEGADVRVLSGPFKDHIARLVSAREGDRAQIMLSGLFAGAPFKIDPKNLEAVEERKAA